MRFMWSALAAHLWPVEALASNQFSRDESYDGHLSDVHNRSMMTRELTLATANFSIVKGFGFATFGRGIAFRSSLRTMLSDFC